MLETRIFLDPMACRYAKLRAELLAGSPAWEKNEKKWSPRTTYEILYLGYCGELAIAKFLNVWPAQMMIKAKNESDLKFRGYKIDVKVQTGRYYGMIVTWDEKMTPDIYIAVEKKETNAYFEIIGWEYDYIVQEYKRRIVIFRPEKNSFEYPTDNLRPIEEFLKLEKRPLDFPLGLEQEWMA